MNEQSSSLRKIDNILGNTVQMLCALLLSVVVILVSVSIFTRFIFFSSLNFADPLSKYIMIWMCFLGFGLAIRSGEHVVVDMFSNSLTDKGRRKLIVFINIIVSIFLLVVIYNGFTFAIGGVNSKDPFVFGISMLIPYLSVPIGFMYMLIQLNITTILSLRSLGKDSKGDIEV